MTVGRLASRGRSSHFPTLFICLFVAVVATCGGVSATSPDTVPPPNPLDATVKDLRTDVDKLKQDYAVAKEIADLKKEVSDLKRALDDLKKARESSWIDGVAWAVLAIVGVAFAGAWGFVNKHREAVRKVEAETAVSKEEAATRTAEAAVRREEQITEQAREKTKQQQLATPKAPPP